MAAPSPDLVVKNPPPLNAATKRWPGRVNPFPAHWLLAIGGLERGVQPRELEQDNPERWED